MNDTQIGHPNIASLTLSGVPFPMIGAGKKYDSGKSPVWQGLVQYFPLALSEIAKVSDYGAKKYNLEFSERNWEKVEGAKERYEDALLRHILDETTDPYDGESGLLHAAHAAWNALAVLELVLKEKKVE